MRAIFISYRREDSEGHAGRLFEDLCERFGRGAVFMDVAGIEPGRDFRRVIETQVASCGVLLAVIGRNWLSVVDRDGKRRLDDPYDFVRLETASALRRDIPVIPVLVHDAVMPRAEQLPDELKDLAFRNSVELSHARWASDVQLLVDALLRHVDPAVQPVPAPAIAPAPGPNWRVLVPLATLAAVGAGYIAWDQLAAGAASSPVVGNCRVRARTGGVGRATGGRGGGARVGPRIGRRGRQRAKGLRREGAAAGRESLRQAAARQGGGTVARARDRRVTGSRCCCSAATCAGTRCCHRLRTGTSRSRTRAGRGARDPDGAFRPGTRSARHGRAGVDGHAHDHHPAGHPIRQRDRR